MPKVSRRIFPGFYSEARRKWFLIFQIKEKSAIGHLPVFSTSPDISDPGSWTAHQTLLRKDSSGKWIDFRVIAHEGKAYLFYTENHGEVMVRSTDLAHFPSGWGPAKEAFGGIQEAVHVYKVRGKHEFHMVYELNNKGVRSFGLATAPHPEGPWRKVTDTYATGCQLGFNDGQVWTDMVSHGELIRSGHDERMEYEPGRERCLIQGILRKNHVGQYLDLSWQLGLMQRHMPGKSRPGGFRRTRSPARPRSLSPGRALRRLLEDRNLVVGEQAQGGSHRQAGIEVAAGSAKAVVLHPPELHDALRRMLQGPAGAAGGLASRSRGPNRIGFLFHRQDGRTASCHSKLRCRRRAPESWLSRIPLRNALRIRPRRVF